MILKKHILLVMSFLLIISCNENDVEITPINQSYLSIDSEAYRIAEGCYERVFILDSFLIMTTRCDDAKIHVYNKKNLQLITKFGTEGLAPFELPRVWQFNNSSITDQCNSIHFYDARLWQMKTINLNKILSGENIADCISSNNMDKFLFFSHNLTMLDNHKIAGRLIDEPVSKGMFFIYDTLKKETKWINYVPKIKIPEGYRVAVFYGVLNANISKNSIIYASSYFDQVLFYDLEGNLKKQHIFSKLKAPKLSNQIKWVENGSIWYANSTYATDEYCFVYRVCQPILENSQNPTIQILVFNWDGLLVNAFEIPYVSHICYDEEFGFFYTIERSREENDPYVMVRKYKIDDYL